MNNEILIVKQAAESLKVSDKSVQKLIARKKLLASKVDLHSCLIKKSDIDAFLHANTFFFEKDINYGKNT